MVPKASGVRQTESKCQLYMTSTCSSSKFQLSSVGHLGGTIHPWVHVGSIYPVPSGCSAHDMAYFPFRDRDIVRLIIHFVGLLLETNLSFLLSTIIVSHNLGQTRPGDVGGLGSLGAINKCSSTHHPNLELFPGKNIQESSPEEFPLNKQKFASLLIFTHLEKTICFCCQALPPET